MKFIRIEFLVFLIAFSLIISACHNFFSVMNKPGDMDMKAYLNILNTKLVYTNNGMQGLYPARSPAGLYGKLKVTGTQLCDENGNPVVLRGLFLRALLNESKFVNHESFAWLSKKWKIDVLRVPFYSDSWYSEPSYIHQQGFIDYIHKTVNLCEEFGMYCIIDWHILGDGNPFIHAKEAREFFKELAFIYGSKKHVIYEICNEPSGKSVTWNNIIKPYAEYVIPVIRAGDSNAIIIVGTGTWSQDVQDAALNPLSYQNIMYAFHFYAGTHRQVLRDRVNETSYKIPLLCTEWGTTGADARGGPYFDEAEKWVTFMNNRKISWCNYALTDFQEDAALLRPGSKNAGSWEKDSLTLSGKYVVNLLINP